jgi:RHH-type transcriptional regulator, rel operon repressor / antitoxin RelB
LLEKGQLERYTGIPKEKSDMLTIRLTPEIEKRLDLLAKRTGQTRTSFVREAILNQLEDIEDRYLAEQAWLEHKATGKPAIPLEEVLKRLGLNK